MNKFAKITLFLLPITILFLIFYKIIFEKGFFMNGDSILGYFTYFYYFVHGGPLISQNLLLGFPVFSSNTGTWFYPINTLFFNLFGDVSGYVNLVIINIILTYIFSFLFFKKHTKSFIASVFFGLVFLFNGQNMLWIETLGNTNYYFVFPLILYLYEFIKNNKYKWIFRILIGFFLGTIWLSGHVQYVLYIHTIYAIYALFINGFDYKKYKQYIGDIVLPNIISFILGYSQIISILNFKPNSIRESGVMISDVFSGAYSFNDLIHFILPFFRTPILSWSSPNLYIGILPFLLLITSIIAIKNNWQDKLYRFSFFTFLFCFIASFKYSPIAYLLHYLPLFDSLREGPRIMFIGFMFGAILIAKTIINIENKDFELNILNKINNIFGKIFLFIVLPLVSIFSIGYGFFFNKISDFINNYFINHIYNSSHKLPKEHYINVLNQYIKDLNIFTIFNYQMVVFIVFSLLTYVFIKNINKFRDLLLPISIVLVSLNILFVYMFNFKSIPREEILKLPSTVQFIKDNGGNMPYRVYSVFPGLSLYNKYIVSCKQGNDSDAFYIQKEMMSPNINMIYGIDIIDGYDNFIPKILSDKLAYIGSENSFSKDNIINKDSSIQEKIIEIQNNKDLLKLLNVKYIISMYKFNDIDFKLVKTNELPCNNELYIYELKSYLPRYFYTDSIDNIKKEINISEIVPSYKKEETELNFTSEKDGYVFIGNTYLPSYEIYINNKKEKPSIYENLFMIIPIKKGENEIVIKYPVNHSILDIFKK
jgi:hypothetical protein